ncbi:MAG: ferritin-like domain-containing protein [Planctomycetota bacterium]|jgi:bacterioferritin (cytochrome b1)
MSGSDPISREEALQRLNELYAEEIEAGLRYLHLSVSLKGLDRLMIRKVLLENMEETFEHAQQVGEKMMQLGASPSLSLQLELPAERADGRSALRTAVLFERAALDAYRELLERVDGGDDVVLEEFARAQVALESQHVAEIELLLED